MKSAVIHGIKTRLSHDGLSLHLSAIFDHDPRSNRAAIRFGPDEEHFKPIQLALEVVSKQGRGFVQIDDYHIDVSVVVEITKGAASTAMCCGNPRTRLF